MRVLVVHNRYRSSAPSGENQVVDAEINLLRDSGVEVAAYLEDSDELVAPGFGLGKATAAVGPVYSPRGVPRFRRFLADVRPDVVHVHNVFPLVSPWIMRVSKAAGVPVVQTVHNYRHSCLNGLHVRDGRRCDDCVGRTVPWPGVLHACYRDSRVQSIPMAVSQTLHKPTWRTVDAFLALTPFMRERLISAGLPSDRVVLRPTWSPDPGASPVVAGDFAYIGRLDEPKGLPLLLSAWQRLARDGRKLLIAGAGPLQAQVEALAAADESVVYLGPLDRRGVDGLLTRCGVVIVPSVVYEGFPLTVVEAFAKGRPVVVTRGGSAASIVSPTTAWTVPLEPTRFAHVLSAITLDDCVARGREARNYYERFLTPEAALASLIAIYHSVLAVDARTPQARGVRGEAHEGL